MMLERISISDLGALLKPHMRKPAWPGLDDPSVRARAVRYARKYGLWQRLTETIERDKDIPATRFSEYRHYRRTGDHRKYDGAFHAEIQQLELAALGLWLGHPAADLDLLQDRLWAWCDHHTWVPPFHEGCRVDLLSSTIGRLVTEILWMFRGRIEEEVAQRVRGEVQKRVLDPVYDYRNADWWRTSDMNWNAVCNANAISAALYHFDDPYLLAAYMHPVIQRLQYAVNGFLDDGSCREGPGYWNYGFGHIVDAAVVLHHRTGGKLNLLADQKVERICRFPVACQIEGPVRVCFGDDTNGYIGANIALGINRFYDMPELYTVAARHPDRALSVMGWRGLALYRGQKAGKSDPRDRFLPDLGMVMMRAGGSGRGTVVAALTGRNDFPHNHNDIGSFMVYRSGACLVTDPGRPIYTGKTFGPHRYEIIQCRSRGHSVPVVNGREQSAGGRYFGTMTVAGLDSDGDKTAVLDMTHAYDDPTLRDLCRRLVLKPDGRVELTDTYRFSRKPRSVEEAFVTYEPVKVLPGGRGVRIGKGRAALILEAVGSHGRFSAEGLGAESRTEHTRGELTRIAFTPSALGKYMTLAFRMRQTT